MSASPHIVATERSRALHAAVASRLGDGVTLALARARVATWMQSGSIHPRYAMAWDELLSLAEGDIARRLVEQSERMDDLRQVSPFAGALDARERWKILRSVRP